LREGTAAEFSGFSVSLSSNGNTVAIGAFGYSSNAGCTRIYDWNGSTWTIRGALIAGGTASEQSGNSVSLSSDGNTVAIGANNYSSGAGCTRIYSWNGTTWAIRGALIAGGTAAEFSGNSVSLSSDGSVVAIGAYGYTSNTGCTRIYSWNGSTWTIRGALIAGGTTGEYSGYSVSLSSDGSVVAIGAYGYSSNTGCTRIYDWNGTTWTIRGALIAGGTASEYSGYYVSLSSNGSVVAIGAYGYGSNSGCTRIYSWNGTTWTIRGELIAGGTASECSGWSVSLSSDGGVVAIGARWYSSKAGCTRIYSYISNNYSPNYDISIGYQAGQTNQTQYAIAIGANAGQNAQGTSAIAIGTNAGQTGQHANTIILNSSGVALNSGTTGAFYVKPIRNLASNNVNSLFYDINTNEITYTTGAGGPTGGTGGTGQTGPKGDKGDPGTSGGASVPSGISSGDYLYWNNTWVVGSTNIKIGSNAGEINQKNYAVAIGAFAGQNTQGLYAVAIGQFAGQNTQGNFALAIGRCAGQTQQGATAVAIGSNAGSNTQGQNTVAIGNTAGSTQQADSAVAIGYQAGQNTQGQNAVAIGPSAGLQKQGQNAVAVGSGAGSYTQGICGIAIGSNAGCYTQGRNAIAIGNQAGYTGQHTNTIILNSSGLELNSSFASAFYVKPVRPLSSGTTYNLLMYDTTTSEIACSSVSSSSFNKTFIIDHPDDPSKYLVHTCLEGPEVGVYYRGKGEIENNEFVVIHLPQYVSNLAYDFTIQLTHIYDGQDKNFNLVATEVENNQFTVYGKNGKILLDGECHSRRDGG
jgi:hypothetical protein